MIAQRIVLAFLALVIGGVGFVLLFLIGEGPPPLGRVPPHIASMFVAQVICLIGFIAVWRWRLGGGIVSLVGIAAFHAVNYAASGRFPGGWVFPLFFVPGLLAIVSWTLGKSQGTKAIS